MKAQGLSEKSRLTMSQGYSRFHLFLIASLADSAVSQGGIWRLTFAPDLPIPSTRPIKFPGSSFKRFRTTSNDTETPESFLRISMRWLQKREPPDQLILPAFSAISTALRWSFSRPQSGAINLRVTICVVWWAQKSTLLPANHEHTGFMNKWKVVIFMVSTTQKMIIIMFIGWCDK